MNYNAQAGFKQPFGKKIKRVSDVNAMGYGPYDNSNRQQNVYPNLDQQTNTFDTFQQETGFSVQPDYNTPYGGTPRGPQVAPQAPGFGYAPSPSPGPYGNVPPVAPTMTPNLGMIGQPIMQDMAMQYGQQLAGAGSSIIQKEVEKYVPVTKLKYYFAVDTRYVISKLLLLFFPFTHSDWSVKYEQDGPVQPRFEINAPDLYIPTMAYFTYVLIAGLVLGMQDRFSPEQIGILASSALAWCVVELAVYSFILYILNVQTTLRTLDLLAYAGYKFVGIITGIMISLFSGRTGFYVSLVYSNFALAFFLIRSLKVQVLSETNQDPRYYVQAHTTGHKRRLYFLLFVASLQPVLSWWLSFHLMPPSNGVTS